MPTYRHKPTVTEAHQFHSEAAASLAPPGVFFDPPHSGLRPYVITIHGAKTMIQNADYIVREPDGRHYYPCKPEIFESHYEAVGEWDESWTHPKGPFPAVMDYPRELVAGTIIRENVDHDIEKMKFFLTISVGELAQKVVLALKAAGLA